MTSNVRGLLRLVLLGPLYQSCATTQQATSVEPSGFLEDYSLLEPGREGDPLLIYRNPKAAFTLYGKVIVESIQIRRTDDEAQTELPDEEAQTLASYLRDAVIEKLGQDYRIVDTPGPGVLRLRAALTEGARSSVVLDTLSVVAPPARLLSLVDRLTSGAHSFVGRASAEAELTDSVTGERLLAGVDRRAGSKVLRGSYSEWADVKAVLDFWAEGLRDRLRRERAGAP